MLLAHRSELAQSWTCHLVWLKFLASAESNAVLTPSILSGRHQVHRDAQVREPEASTSRSWQAVQPTGSWPDSQWHCRCFQVSQHLDIIEQFPISGLSPQGQTNTAAENKVGWQGLARRAERVYHAPGVYITLSGWGHHCPKAALSNCLAPPFSYVVWILTALSDKAPENSWE